MATTYLLAIAILAPLVLASAWVLMRSWSRPAALEEAVTALLTGGDRIDPTRVHNWLPTERRWNDRRKAERRRGLPTRIWLARSPGPVSSGVEEGLVFDRSTGGLGFACWSAWPVGEQMYLLAAAAPPGTSWVPVTVRSCRAMRGCFVIGCEFFETPPWAVMLLFG
jgi:hypothetical protein